MEKTDTAFLNRIRLFFAGISRLRAQVARSTARRSRTTGMMSRIGLAFNPGTAVLPM